MNKKKIIVSVLGILGIVLAAIGITFAFFSYSKTGTKEHSISSGAITFNYKELSQGIALTDAMPMTDIEGKSQNDYFDFSVTSKTSKTIDIPYYITVKSTANSDTEMADIVKVYLTKVDNNGNETEVLLSDVNNLGTYTHNSITISVTERLLHSDRVYAGDTNYEQRYRLRMWISDDAEFIIQEPGQSDVYPYDGMSYALTVNVYSSGEEMNSAQAEIRNNVNVDDITIGENVVTSDTTTFTGTEYIQPGQESITKVITVNTENPNAVVTIDNLTPTSSLIKESNVKRLSSNHTITLVYGTNTFRITVSSPNKQTHKEYTLIINVEYPIFGALLTGNHITFEDNNIDIEYGGSGTVIVQPANGYYLSGASCTNGYTVAAQTGTSATGLQTVTISNNNNIGSSICIFTVMPVTYTITYNLNGGTLTSANPITYTIETPTFTLNNPTMDEYVFGGWVEASTSEKQTTVTITQGSIGNKTYSATYKDGAGLFDAQGNQLYSWSEIEAYGIDVSVDLSNSNGNSATRKFYANNLCTNATKLVIPKTVDYIGGWQFQALGNWGCRSITELVVNAKNIGNYAFNGNTTYITSLTLGNEVETIGDGAFGLNIDSVTVPASVTYLGLDAFRNCPLNTLEFANPDNWYYYSTSTLLNLSDTAQNVTYHTQTYRQYWRKVLPN